MSKTNKLLLTVVIVLLLVLVGLGLWRAFSGGQSYHAVLLRTGDLYFGQLTRFPSFGLKNVYLLQINTQDQQNPISIQKFTSVFWGPQDKIKLNRDEVVWTTKLDPEGQLAQVIKANPDLLPQTAPTPTVQQAVPTAPTAPAVPLAPQGEALEGGQ